MYGVYFGIIMGVFLGLGGRLVVIGVINYLRKRKTDNEQRLVEIVEQIVNKD